jgi:uncharacterized protein (DUF4415 family)
MPKLKPGTVVPTPEEDVVIDAGISADDDNPEWTDKDFARARPATEVLGAEAVAALKRQSGQRGPQKKSPTKEMISIRLSREVVAAFRATGEGWQTRVDEVLLEHVRQHRGGL